MVDDGGRVESRVGRRSRWVIARQTAATMTCLPMNLLHITLMGASHEISRSSARGAAGPDNATYALRDRDPRQSMALSYRFDDQNLRVTGDRYF